MAVIYKLFDKVLNQRSSDILDPNAVQKPQNTPDQETPGSTLPLANQANTSGFAGITIPTKKEDVASVKGNAAGAYFNEANKKALSQGFTENVMGKVKTASEDLKAKASEYNSYISQAADADKVSPDLKAKALSGDQASIDSIANILGKQFNASQFDYNNKPIQDVTDIADPNKRRAMLDRESQVMAQGKYTKGMSRLDNALLDASNINYEPIFQENQQLQKAVDTAKATAATKYDAELQQLKGQQLAGKADLSATNNTLAGQSDAAFKADAATRAEAIRQARMAAINDQVKNSGIDDMIAELVAQRDGLDAQVAAHSGSMQRGNSGAIQQAKNRINDKIGQLKYDRDQIINGAYASVGADNNSAANYVTQEQANQRNILNKLLGITDIVQAGSKQGPSVSRRDDELSARVTALRAILNKAKNEDAYSEALMTPTHVDQGATTVSDVTNSAANQYGEILKKLDPFSW